MERAVVAGLGARFNWLVHLGKGVLLSRHRELIPSLRPYIPRDAVIFDVGANAGQMAKLFAGMAPAGRVYAFEPGAYALSILRPAVWASGRSNIEVLPLGLADRPSEETLRIPLKKDGGYNFGLSHLGPDQGDRPVVETRITLTTIDQFVAARQLSRLDFVKIDIEGWEVRCLGGAAETLPRFLPTLMIEVNAGFLARAGSAPEELFGPLRALGYRIHRLDSGLPVEAYDGPSDYIFVHPSRAAAKP